MLRCPTIEQLRRIATDQGLHLSDAELESFRRLIGGALESYRRVDRLADPIPAVTYPRGSGHRPRPEDNPYNAWYWRCSIHGAPDGPLAGKRVAIKDNVCVAGIPMNSGTYPSRIEEPFIIGMPATQTVTVIATRCPGAGPSGAPWIEARQC